MDVVPCTTMVCILTVVVGITAPPLPARAKDIDRLALNAERLISHIPLMRLLATVNVGLHCRVGLNITSTGTVYKNPIGDTWRVNYVGRILPTMHGSRHCAVGDQERVSL